MEFKGDTKGLDALIRQIDERSDAVLTEVGRDACRLAQNDGNYQNRTGNLRNGNGFCIVRDGEVIKMEVLTDGAHPEAVQQTENLLLYSNKPEDGLYLANGMDYASFVESRGYEVLMSKKLYAARQIKKKL
jgi:hypothetical protein